MIVFIILNFIKNFIAIYIFNEEHKNSKKYKHLATQNISIINEILGNKVIKKSENYHLTNKYRKC